MSKFITKITLLFVALSLLSGCGCSSCTRAGAGASNDKSVAPACTGCKAGAAKPSDKK